MSYLQFDKSNLVNLEYSLVREILRTNKVGSYLSTTISGCNTRKYHGLLVCQNKLVDSDRHVLLSSLDETVIQHEAEFNLGIHRYEGNFYEPKGHKYIRDFDAQIGAKTTFRVGGVVMTKELMLDEDSEQVLIRYTLCEANSPTTLRFKPFLAFRSIHALTKANLYINTRYNEVDNGIQVQLYENYPSLFLQFSKNAEFVAFPNWYNNIEYMKEKERGYDYREDLFVPGYFELPIEKGESIIFSASTVLSSPKELEATFMKNYNGRIPHDSFFDCLKRSAEQFLKILPDKANITAGFPWYHGITRQTFIALPGLIAATSDFEIYEKILDSQLVEIRNGLFPLVPDDCENDYHGMDVPLWFLWSLQQLAFITGENKRLWEKYKNAINEILSAYKQGMGFDIKMQPNGLISGGDGSLALTWMDSYKDGKPVVSRQGMPVEVNALWYNGICFAMELAKESSDNQFVEEWEPTAEKIADSFVKEFWDEKRGYLADSINGDVKDWNVRPNMVIAASLAYTPLSKEMQKSILSTAKKELLTARGLRTLSPESSKYKGICEDNVIKRESALHQGVAWPWLIQFFVEGYLRLHKRGGLPFVQKLVDGFEEDMTEHCIGTIAEMYNGDPPHIAKGAISQAWSVASILRSWYIVYRYKNIEDKL